MIVLLAALVAVCGGVVVVAVGRGGQLAEFVHDAPPLGLPDRRPIAGTDVALLRLPAGPWGYSFRATDEALRRIAHAMTERDTRIAILEQQVADLRSGGPAREDREEATESPWFDRGTPWGDRPSRPPLPSRPVADALTEPQDLPLGPGAGTTDPTPLRPTDPRTALPPASGSDAEERGDAGPSGARPGAAGRETESGGPGGSAEAEGRGASASLPVLGPDAGRAAGPEDPETSIRPEAGAPGDATPTGTGAGGEPASGKASEPRPGGAFTAPRSPGYPSGGPGAGQAGDASVAEPDADAAGAGAAERAGGAFGTSSSGAFAASGTDAGRADDAAGFSPGTGSGAGTDTRDAAAGAGASASSRGAGPRDAERPQPEDGGAEHEGDGAEHEHDGAEHEDAGSGTWSARTSGPAVWTPRRAWPAPSTPPTERGEGGTTPPAAGGAVPGTPETPSAGGPAEPGGREDERAAGASALSWDDGDEDWAFEDDVEPVIEPLGTESASPETAPPGPPATPESSAEPGAGAAPSAERPWAPPAPGDRLVASTRGQIDPESGRPAANTSPEDSTTSDAGTSGSGTSGPGASTTGMPGSVEPPSGTAGPEAGPGEAASGSGMAGSGTGSRAMRSGAAGSAGEAEDVDGHAGGEPGELEDDGAGEGPARGEGR